MHVEVNSFVKSEVSRQCFLQKLSKIQGKTMQKLTRISSQVIFFSFDTSVCCISVAQLLTICVSYALYICYPVMYSLSKSERVAVNMQGTVFILARLKIFPSYPQELVSHPMPEHIEALASLITKKILQ